MSDLAVVVKRLKKVYHTSQIPANLSCSSFELFNSATFEFTVDEATMSSSKNMFGGVVASLTDSLTSIVLLGEKSAFVSSGISVRYFRPAPLGSTVTVKSTVVFSGKAIKHCEAKFLNAQGKLIAIGTHDLVVVTAKI